MLKALFYFCMFSATIVSLDDTHATIRLDDGQELRVALGQIEGVPTVGSMVTLIAAIPGAEGAARTQLARDLLNGLLSG